MTKVRSTVMKDRNNKAKEIIAELLDQNKDTNFATESIKECWMEFAIMLGRYTPKWLAPDSNNKHDTRLWNLLTQNIIEKEYTVEIDHE